MSSSESDTLADASEQETWDDWTEDEDDDGVDPVKSLFSDTVLASAEAAFEHDAQNSGFDLRAYKQQAHLDDYGVIKCINYIRKEVAEGRDPRPALSNAATQQQKPWDDDAYLRPVLSNDGLLFHDFDDADETAAVGDTRPPAALEVPAPLQKQVQELREENDTLRYLLAEMRSAAIPDELLVDLQATSIEDPAVAGPSRRGPASPASSSQPAPLEGGQQRTLVQRVDRTYFESYSYFDIHREMLGDKPRTEAYREALEKNPGLMKGAAVLDVGCGTGILSMFAARGGARQVVGVDGSERIAGVARRVVGANGLGVEQGGPVAVVAGKLEELKELPVQQVDVIVSEWMGYALLFETMLETVLHARDRFLKPGGAVLPDLASIFLAAAGEGATGLDFWKDVYGFSMEPIRSSLQQSGTSKALVGEVKQQDIISEPVLLQELDMCTMTPAQQDFSTDFTLRPSATSSSAAHPQVVHALVIWFDTHFSARFCPEHPVVLSTSPFRPTTHWAQTILTLRTPVPLGSGPGSAPEIKGRLSMVRSQKHRGLDISVEYEARVEGGAVLKDILMFNMDIHASGDN